METLYSIYKAVQEYRDTASTPIEEAIPPLDAYLLYIILDSFENAITVHDRSILQTDGTSLVLIASHPKVKTVITDSNHAAHHWLEQRENTAKVIIGGTLDSTQSRNLLLMSGRDAARQHYSDDIQINTYDTILLLTYDQKRGNNPLFRMLMSAVDRHPDYDFLFVRDVNPIVGKSNLVLLWSSEVDPIIRNACARIEHQFTSNFDLLSLLENTLDDLIANSPTAKEAQNQLFHYHEQDETLLQGGLIQWIYHLLVPLNFRLILRDYRREKLGR